MVVSLVWCWGWVSLEINMGEGIWVKLLLNLSIRWLFRKVRSECQLIVQCWKSYEVVEECIGLVLRGILNDIGSSYKGKINGESGFMVLMIGNDRDEWDRVDVVNLVGSI